VDPGPPVVTLGKPIVIAHRGASGYLPEHTLAAYELAIKMGADYIEPDLQFTSDGHLVAVHDDTLDRTTNVATLFPNKRNGHNNYPVSDFTLAEIKTLSVVPQNGIGSGTSRDSYPGFTPGMADPFKVPTFGEVIDFAKAQGAKYGREIGIYPEAKQADPAMEDGILETLAAHGMNKSGSPVFIQSFSEETIASMYKKQLAQGARIPQIVLGVAIMKDGVAKMGVWRDLVSWSYDSIEALDLKEVAKIASGIGVGLGPDYVDYPLTRAFIEQAHAAGLVVHTWTFEEVDAIAAQKEYRDYLDIGMDGMFSNYPDLALLARDQFDKPNDRFMPDLNPNAPIVISHRGASGYLPEHTLAAYELAIRMGVDYIEPDLQTTSDGHLVAMHDDTLDRTTNVAALFAKRNGHNDYPVSDFTLAEIKTLTVVPPAGTPPGSGTASTSYPGYTPGMADPFKVPTFEEVIDFAKAQSAKYGRKVGIYPEAKQADPAMEDGILAALAAKGMDTAGSPVFIQSFSAPTARSIYNKQVAQGKSLPVIQLGYAVMDNGVAKVGLAGDPLDGENVVALSKVATYAKGLGLVIGYPTYALTRDYIDQAHAAGLKVHGWTFSKTNAIDAAKEYHDYLAMGMDGYFTNFANLGVLARDWFIGN
jgi:glycerophosphoryl diester phosphodiesterase